MEMNNHLKKVDALEIIELPAAAVTQLFYDVQLLAKMHQDLIKMYEMESTLKKHHKAYLHVRDQADEMCQFDKQAVNVILDHYENPKRYINQAISFHNTLHEEYKACQDTHTDAATEATCDGPSCEPKEDQKMDVFDLPHDMVMMSVGTLKAMQDDMLALTTAVDALVDAFVKIEEDGGYNHVKMHHLTGSAAEIAKDVFRRWDDAELNELS